MFQKYKYVLAVYEERCFTKAAKRLYISQPSLSVAIRNVESKVGMPLFERCGTSLNLTQAGKAYIEAAQKMKYAESAFQKQIEDIAGLQTGKLVVGGSNYLTSDVVSKLVSRFSSLYPGVEIMLTEANSTNLRERLEKEEVDLVIDNFGNFPEQYQRYPLAEEQVLLCVSGDRGVNHSLAEFGFSPEQLYTDPDSIKAIPPIDISLFKGEPFVLLKQGNDMYDRAMGILKSGKIAPEVVFQVDQLNISYALAESGSGACFITDTFFKYRKYITNAVLYKIDHAIAKRTLHIVHKRGRYCTKAMEAFIQVAQEMMGCQ